MNPVERTVGIQMFYQRLIYDKNHHLNLHVPSKEEAFEIVSAYVNIHCHPAWIVLTFEGPCTGKRIFCFYLVLVYSEKF